VFQSAAFQIWDWDEARMTDTDIEFTDEEDATLAPSETARFSDAVLYSSDWTVETVLSQLARGNIELNPRFQRRDAWSVGGKSRFIESCILGLPIPQIVLAEKRNSRGQFIVLDGKQRLLSLLQFTGKSEGRHNAFGLSGLEARTDLKGKRYRHFEADPLRHGDLNAFLNHTLRTVVIRNWPDNNFLHLVFLRLNTGSVKLSPQELRQAIEPGDFTEMIDDAAVASIQVQRLLSRESPDPRMRDVELMTRFLSFRLFLDRYTGRMKDFLDESCRTLNSEPDRLAEVGPAIEQFNLAVEALAEIFQRDQIARKPGSKSFNRAIFDALIFYAATPRVREAMLERHAAVREAYEETLADPGFIEAVESDTAGIPHTYDRLAVWGRSLADALGLRLPLPALVQNEEGNARIAYGQA